MGAQRVKQVMSEVVASPATVWWDENPPQKLSEYELIDLKYAQALGYVCANGVELPVDE